jgi:hypothetical protein
MIMRRRTNCEFSTQIKGICRKLAANRYDFQVMDHMTVGEMSKKRGYLGIVESRAERKKL